MKTRESKFNKNNQKTTKSNDCEEMINNATD